MRSTKLVGHQPSVEVVVARAELPARVQGSPIPEPTLQRLAFLICQHPKPFTGMLIRG
jgi:hypothetical protein